MLYFSLLTELWNFFQGSRDLAGAFETHFSCINHKFISCEPTDRYKSGFVPRVSGLHLFYTAVIVFKNFCDLFLFSIVSCSFFNYYSCFNYYVIALSFLRISFENFLKSCLCYKKYFILCV